MFQEWPVKEIELAQPDRLETSEDNGVTDAKASRSGLYLPFPEEEMEPGDGRAGMQRDLGMPFSSHGPFVIKKAFGAQSYDYDF
jgi:hypothetical protein